ncbi:hypothetical protein [Streptomyces sp. NPDC058374]|uniref:hypothetical protein n=1 Tax=unclassified Streptomyces TaxID=2593676 RepID=UPI00365A7034
MTASSAEPNGPEAPDDAATEHAPEAGPPARPVATAQERRRLAEETRSEKYVWWSLGYFFFGIHIVAFVMIYAVTHAR